MNANLIRTLIAIFTAVVGAATLFFGCDSTGANCSVPFLNAQTLGVVTVIVGASHLILKGLGGFTSLISATAPVDSTVAPAPKV